MSTTSRASIRIAGDSTIDWRVAMPEGATTDDILISYQWTSSRHPGIAAEAGGAALLGAVIRGALEDSEVSVFSPRYADHLLADPIQTIAPRAFEVWRTFSVDLKHKTPVWRRERFLGAVRADESTAPPVQHPDEGSASVVVLDDAGLGFNERDADWPPELLPDALPPRHLLAKFSGSFRYSPMWNRVIGDHIDRLTTYVAVGDLRKGDAAIGQPHSWQQTAEEVVRAARSGKTAARGQRVIVSLGFAGAVLLDRDGGNTLIFDPAHQEEDWERRRPGATPGLGTCVMAALAIAASRNPAMPDWVDAIAHGLLAARAVHEHGFYRDQRGAITFPLAVATDELRKVGTEQSVFSCARIREGTEWLVPVDRPKQLWEIARTVVEDGGSPELLGLPVERMGHWASVDRTEIESVRSVRFIVNQYLSNKGQTRPLNLAVFGPPGSGKSFAVKQMSEEWKASGEPIETLEFNVAQFTSTADLVTALQRVRDSAVRQKLPLVFWDEFDASIDGRKLGWLARFLAPMQDGTFLEGGFVRPIGPAIFVFAGGVHATLASFQANAINVEGAKATDFLSRLRAHIDVLGPNPPDDDTNDFTFVLRRALLFRAQLEAKARHLIENGKVHIDRGVLRAFLVTRGYHHGTRSMEALIEMSALSNRMRFERSALPTPYQMMLHVNPDEFLHWLDHESPFEQAIDTAT